LNQIPPVPFHYKWMNSRYIPTISHVRYIFLLSTLGSKSLDQSVSKDCKVSMKILPWIPLRIHSMFHPVDLWERVKQITSFLHLLSRWIQPLHISSSTPSCSLGKIENESVATAHSPTNMSQSDWSKATTILTNPPSIILWRRT